MTQTIGSLVIDLQDKELSPEERELVAHPLVGGVILFTRNYETPKQLTALCQALKKARSAPLLIMVDQEGGRVQRFIEEFTRLPRMGVFGKLYQKNAANACKLAHDCAWLMASELLSVGVDLSLAPVLDLNKGVSTVIGERAFHADPAIVIDLATAFIQGMKEAGMAATGKHFPGHGTVSLDSHVAMPVDNRTFSDIATDDLIPFTTMIKSGINAIMAAHIIFPQVDKLPVGYSPHWLQVVLRKQLGFTGTIFSDDLTMEGANISANYADRVEAAREAGCDFALVCNNRSGVVQVLDTLVTEKHLLSQEKWRPLLGKLSGHYRETERWQTMHDLLQQLNSSVC